MIPVQKMRTQLERKYFTEQRLNTDELDTTQLRPDPRGKKIEGRGRFVPSDKKEKAALLFFGSREHTVRETQQSKYFCFYTYMSIKKRHIFQNGKPNDPGH